MSQQNPLSYEDVLEIVELIKSSTHFSEFHLKVGDVEVDVRRANGASHAAPPGMALKPAPAEPVRMEERAPSAPPAEAREARHGEARSWPEGSVVVRSPMVGTFYRSPQPGAPPFVEIGREVAADAVVCIIEVMKLMNSIPAGHAGVVTHILVEDGAPVEYGQPLVVLRPH